MKVDIGRRIVELQRIVGSLGWPSDQPGFVVIVGEEVIQKETWPKTGSETHYHVLMEAEHSDVRMLLQSCTALASKWKTVAFYARLQCGKEKKLPVIHFLEVYNQNAFAKGVAPFYPIEPPFTEDRGLITYHVHVLRDLLKPEARRLHIWDTSSLKGALLQIPHDVNSITDLAFPAVAALGYAVAAMEAWNITDDQQLEANRLLKEMYLSSRD